MTRQPRRWVYAALVLGAAAACSTTSSTPRSTQPAGPQDRVRTPEDAQLVRVACEDVRRGSVVAFTPFDIPSSCGAAASARDHEVTVGEPRLRVLADSAAYSRELGCEGDGPIDFDRERLAVYSYVRNSSDVYRLSEVRSLEGNVVLVFDVERRCQGARQRAHGGDLAARIPRSEEPVAVAICAQQARCDALLP